MYNTSTLSQSTTDQDLIQEWVEERGGIPARDSNDPSELVIIFDEENTDMTELEKISWDEFFDTFQKNGYEFYYDEEDPDDEEDDGEGDVESDEASMEPQSQSYRLEKGSNYADEDEEKF